MKIAIIPARGKSKRILRKNIKPFNGKPIIAYSIEVAKQSKLFDDIIVTTDDEEIAAVAEQFGANAPFRRPDELSDDFTPTIPVIKHAIEWYEANRSPIDYVCCIYATAPFVRTEDLIAGYNALSELNKSYAFPVTSFPFPIFRSVAISEQGMTPVFPEHILKRSQDLPEAYHDAGQFYWGTREAYLEEKPFFAEHSYPIVIPRYLVQDIDTPEDWESAEIMNRSIIENRSR